VNPNPHPALARPFRSSPFGGGVQPAAIESVCGASRQDPFGDGGILLSELRLERCPYCGAAILTDPMSIDRRMCLFGRRAETPDSVLVSEPLAVAPSTSDAHDLAADADPQQQLFTPQ
jgi:hypothetical protein